MAKAIMGFTITTPHIHSSSLQTTKLDISSSSTRLLGQSSNSELFSGCKQIELGKKSKRASFCRINAFPDWPLMAVLTEHIEGQRDLITHKSIVHLSDENIKNVYTFYIMFTCWGCLFFGPMKDPYYDSETYRGDGGDGTGFWIYEKTLVARQKTVPKLDGLILEEPFPLVFLPTNVPNSKLMGHPNFQHTKNAQNLWAKRFMN